MSFGDLTIQAPFAEAEAVSLYDILGKRGLAGIETKIAAFRGFEGSIGAVTDAELRGAPFVGIRRFVPAGIFSESFYIGLWLGRDFRRSAYQGGIKASVKLWGNK
jgi:hypothetical protein